MAVRERNRVDRPDADTPELGLPPERDRGFGGWIWALVALVIAGLLVWAIWATFDDDTSGLELGATIGDITGDPEAYYGQTVVVSGEVGEIFGGTAMTLGEDELLVVDARLPGQVGDDDIIQVIGTVRPLGSFGSGDPAMADIEGLGLDEQPVVVAEQINLEPRAEAGPQNATLESVGRSEDLVGQTVTIQGTVSEELNDDAFVLRNIVLVVGGADNMREVDEGQEVQVTGTVRDFDGVAFRDEFGFIYSPRLFAPWEGRNAIVATKVTIR